MSYWLSVFSLVCTMLTLIASADALWSCHCIRKTMKERRRHASMGEAA
ncbi:MAG: hypothetical protein J0I92_06475 [Phyllobacterium sp.]|nr:hypothetical protein [Phyllobacterium sp.]